MYSMALVERLGFGTLDNLYSHMTSNDIIEWMAYDMTQNDTWYSKYKKEKDMENQKTQSLEEEAQRMKAMFMGLSK